MSVTTDIKAVLEADSALMDILVGGVYTDDETDRNGIGRTTTPAAYGTSGFLQPCAYVKERAQIGNWGGAYGNSGYTGTRQIIEVWLYEDTAYTAIETAREQVIQLLQRTLIGEMGKLRYQAFVKNRAPELNRAAFFRLDFDLIGMLETDNG